MVNRLERKPGILYTQNLTDEELKKKNIQRVYFTEGIGVTATSEYYKEVEEASVTNVEEELV